MTAIDLLARIAMGWLVLSVIIGGAYAVAMGRRNRRIRDRADIVKRASYPPPVPHPPVKQSELDETWLDAWPTDVEPADIDTLEQRVYDRLFDDLIAIEGLQ